MTMKSLVIPLLLELLCFVNISWTFETLNIEILMPNVHPTKNDEYLHTAKKLELNDTYYIVKFQPKASMDIVHHMILHGCKVAIETKPSNAQCLLGDQILYAWAKNAPDLVLPDKVGFKIGLNSDLDYLVLEVHYGNINNINQDTGDASGPNRAGVSLLGTAGCIKPHTTDYFETACEYQYSIPVHPFAFRTHTHARGVVVTGYNIIKNSNGSQTWQLIGKKNPQLPQFFYSVENKNITVQPGNILAGRCTMTNNENRTICVGGTHLDEMCNFYTMYYVEGDVLPPSVGCFSAGPPMYYWNQDANLNNIPGDDRAM
ncbi:hypothetical protein CHUAL_011927 [Chamberlinius hualienensis]